MKKIYVISFLIFQILFRNNICKKEKVKIGPRKEYPKNSFIDNFDILYKKKTLYNIESDISDDSSTELEKYIYSVLELFDFWEMYNDKIADFNDNFILFFKDFFGVRLQQGSFYCNVKKQLFIDSLIEKVIYFYQQSSKDMKYKFEMQVDYFNSFKFDVLYKFSIDVKMSIIAIEFLSNLFFNNQEVYIDQVKPVDELSINDCQNDNHDNVVEDIDDSNLKKKENINNVRGDKVDLSLNFFLNNSNKMQLISEAAELGLLSDNYLYKLFHEYIMKNLKKHNFLNDLYVIKDIFLEKCLFDKAFSDNDLLLKKLNIIYSDDETCDNTLDQIYLNWLVQRNTILNGLTIVHNEDYLFIFFLTIILYNNLDDNEILISDYEKKILKNKYAISKSILDELSFLASGKKLNWGKLSKIKLNKQMIEDILTIILYI